MCGIVGYIGNKTASSILIKGLRRLEYRGYDSAGIAVMADNGETQVFKKKGKVTELENIVPDTVNETIGIGHTRWATHGKPSTENAHPHTSMNGDIILVHNGIIENYAILRNQLEKNGYKFYGETDTEILANLIEYILHKFGVDLMTAVRISLNRVIGAYAIAVISKHQPDSIIVARKSSPLVIGIGKDDEEYYLASDATPIVEYTQEMVYLNDNEIACLTRKKKLHIVNLKNIDIDPTIQHVDMDLGKLSKDGFPHFMLKEIYDQPNCLKDCMRGRIVETNHGRHEIVLSAVRDQKDRLMKAEHIIIVACGTSWHAGLIGKQLLEKICRKRVTVEYASEFRYGFPVLSERDVVIAISQSGETADTIAAIEKAKSSGAMIFGIVNAVGSSIARISDTGIYTHVGPEIGVASTKAFTGQVLVLLMLALAIGKEMGTIMDEEYQSMIRDLLAIPEKMQTVLKQNKIIEKMAKNYSNASNFLYLGRGFNYPVALEGALKLKEISYIHAEGYPAAEMKHGPIALVDENMPVVFIATHHKMYEKILSNIQEVKSRNGNILAVVTEGDELVSRITKNIIEIPEICSELVPLLSTVPLQLLAYHIAVQKGLDVDMPRNLAKSVTVE